MTNVNKGFASKRSTKRRSMPCFVWLESRGPSGWEPVGIGRCLDLSSRGIGVLTASPVTEGQRLKIDIQILGGLTLQAEGVATHCQMVRAGVHRVGAQFESAPRLVDAAEPDEDAARRAG